MSASATEVGTNSTVTELSPAVADNVSWISSLGESAKNAVKTGWNWFTGAISWLVDRAIDCYKWVEDKVVRGSKWIWAKTQNGASRGKRWTKTAWKWSTEHAALGWNWIADGAIWGWNKAWPALRWMSTPVRVTLGSLFGFAAFQAFGPMILVAAVIAYATWVMITGQFGFSLRSKYDREAARLLAKGGPYTDELNGVLLQRLYELSEQKKVVKDPAMGSSMMGREHLLAERVKFSTLSWLTIYNQMKVSVLKHASPEEIKAIDWVAVKRGVKAEQDHLEFLFARHLETEANLKKAAAAPQAAESATA